MQILILTASAGNGHNAAARAIEDAARQRGWGATYLDVLDVTARPFRWWFQGGYESLVRRWPAMWGHLYRRSDSPGFSYRFQTSLDQRFCAPLKAKLEEIRPDVVVCTHSLPQPWLAEMREYVKCPVAICVTDLHPHRMWLRGEPDWYFAPTESSAELLAKRLPNMASRIEVTGIPIHAAFRSSGAQREADRVLLTAGGIGAGPILKAAKVLNSLDCKLTVVCGRNEALRRSLTEHLPAAEILGLISPAEMAAQLHRAAFTVGKPGGLTTFEALACGTPFLVHWPLLIPGQEEDNARYLVEIGAGVISRTAYELGQLAGRWLGDAATLGQASVNALAAGRADATDTILDRLGALADRALIPHL